MPIRIASFTGGKNDPSSRFRIRSYHGILSREGYLVEDFFLSVEKYPPRNFLNRVFWFAKIIKERSNQILRYSRSAFDVTFLQREMISTLYTFERFVKKPIIFDVDDAIHLGTRHHNIEKIARRADAIICGNIYLANYYKIKFDNVFIVPTPVDTRLYTPKIHRNNKIVNVGWLGTSSNFNYLYQIEKALYQVLVSNENIRLVIVSNEKPVFTEIKDFIFREWSIKSEVKDLHSFDIGIMPLEDSDWAKGKCSFKMLQYMSCGIPVVVSKIGMNVELLNMGNIGFGASNYYYDWISAIEELTNSFDLRKSMGENGRLVVEKNYSTDVCSIELMKIIESLVIKE